MTYNGLKKLKLKFVFFIHIRYEKKTFYFKNSITISFFYVKNEKQL